MDMEFISGPMEVFTKVIGTKIRFQNTENITGTTVGLIKVIGLIIICMEMVSTNGQTVENTKENI